MLWIDYQGNVWETHLTRVGVLLGRRCDMVLSPTRSGYGPWVIVDREELELRVP
jgi:hypothetical protein